MKTVNKPKQIIGGFDNQLEAARGLSDDVRKSLSDDLLRGSLGDFWKQVGVQELASKDNGGEMHEGQEIDLKSHDKKEQPQHVEPGYDYREKILQGERHIHAEDNREMQVKIQEIMLEIKKIVDSSRELQVEFKQLSVEQVPSKPGKYHLNFVEWLLSNVRDIRLKIEDSGAWLAAFKNKKDKKGYWNMFKKHGTSFGLSNERSVATQVG